MFTLGLREGLEAALIVALLATLARGTAQWRPLLWATAAGVAASAVLVTVVRRLHLELSETTLHAIKAVVAVGAVIVLTSTVRWAIGLPSGGRAVGTWMSGALSSVAFLAVLREGLELAVFPAAGDSGRWGPGTPAMAIGVIVAAAIGAVVYLICRETPERMITTMATLLVLIAAGLTAAAVRSAEIVIGWDASPLFEAHWVEHSNLAAQTLVKGLFGVHAAPTPLEFGAYASYAGVVGTWTARSLRRRSLDVNIGVDASLIDVGKV